MNAYYLNAYWLFLIVPISIIIGIFLCSWYISYTLKKALGIKSWKEFINQAKKAQAMQKKIEREGIFGVMNDPVLRKQMEDLQKRFGGKSK